LATGPESWQDTGLYAAPGEVVVVDVPSIPAGRQLKVVVGCHRDNLLRLEKWSRFPVITRTFELKPGRNEVANAFGGLIFLQVLGDPKAKSAPAAPVRFANAVAAPLYRLGTDTPETWARALFDQLTATGSATRPVVLPYVQVATGGLVAEDAAAQLATQIELGRRVVADGTGQTVESTTWVLDDYLTEVALPTLRSRGITAVVAAPDKVKVAGT
ncbi:MAG: hypothetical protein FGM36_15545, partial [Burkholderiaceae bacterium]|nr:hypothetical protein [Burkholderiaceae bacterium]